jgi:Protein of unknown function (DUF3489)
LEKPVTKPKSGPRASDRPTARKTGKPASCRRPAQASSKPATRSNTNNDRIIAIARTSAGATVAALVAATRWQRRSVRGFLAGIVRKKLGLNLVSEFGGKGRGLSHQRCKAYLVANRAKIHERLRYPLFTPSPITPGLISRFYR